MRDDAPPKLSSQPSDGTGPALSPRPQSLMLTFLGIHLLHRGAAVYSGSVIDVFARVGVSEEAVRSTLTRMVKRDLLGRHRRGRRMYFGLTPRSRAVLDDGYRRIWHAGAVNRDWNGDWTVVAFSLPEAWRRERHDLRSRLTWAGFGPLQNGMWIAPGTVDVPAVVDGLDLDGYLTALDARAVAPTAAADLVARAFDIDGIAARYRSFLDRWTGANPADPVKPNPTDPNPTDADPTDSAGGDLDGLARQLVLHTDWLQVVRADPHLPVEQLPPDWPADDAEQLFRRLHHVYEPQARRIAAAQLDVVPLADDVDGDGVGARNG